MKSKIKRVLDMNHFRFLKRFTPFLSIFFLFFQVSVILAQEDTSGITESINILINREVIQTIKIQDENGSALSDEQVTITVDNANDLTLSLLDPEQSEGGFDDNSGILIAMTDDNGQVTFIVKGISEGETSITVEVDEALNITPKQLSINVIGVEAKFMTTNDQQVGERPFEVKFIDQSEGDEIISRKWDFEGGDPPESDEEDPTSIFNDTGLHIVTLEITAQTDIGPVTDSFSKAICVLPLVIGDGFGSVHGVVFNADPLFPLVGARVTLAGVENRVTFTNLRGVFNFSEVIAGDYTIFACKTNLALECAKKQIIVNDGESINVELILERLN